MKAVAARRLDVEHEARAGRSVRMNLDVGEADQVGVHLFGHEKAVALSGDADVRAPDFLVEVRFLPDACVHLLAEFDVGAETARGEDDAARAEDLCGLAAAFHGNARDAAVFFDEARRLRFKEDLHAVGILRERLFEDGDVGVAARGIGIVRALEKRARRGAHLWVHLEA